MTGSEFDRVRKARTIRAFLVLPLLPAGLALSAGLFTIVAALLVVPVVLLALWSLLSHGSLVTDEAALDPLAGRRASTPAVASAAVPR